MDQQVYRTLYCSRNCVEGDAPQQDAEISQILTTARVNNKRQNVTGALLFNAGYFAQVLEGPRDAVEQIFERIQRDDRHGEVTVLECGYGEHRDFSEWSMAYIQPPSEDAIPAIAAMLDHALSTPETSAGNVLDLLRSLVTQDYY